MHDTTNTTFATQNSIINKLNNLCKENERAIEMANNDIKSINISIAEHEKKIQEDKETIAKLEKKIEECTIFNNKIYSIISQYTNTTSY